MISAGQLDILPGILKDGTTNALFPEQWLYETQMCFYTKEGDDWKYSGIESVGNKILAVESGIIHTPEFFQYLKSHSKHLILNGQSIVHRMIKLLKVKRIDAFTTEKHVLAHTLKTSPSPLKLQEAGCFKPEKEFIAISMHHPEAKHPECLQ